MRRLQVPGIPKYSAEDTSLVVGNAAGEKSAFPIPAGSRITVDAVGLHYNRKSPQAAQQPTGVIYTELHSKVLGRSI